MQTMPGSWSRIHCSKQPWHLWQGHSYIHWLPFTVTVVSFHVVFIAGGIVYSLAGTVWMAFVGFGLIGAGVSLGSITVHTYIGEMGTVMDDIRKKQGKKPRKFVLYILYSFMLNGGYIVPFTLNSIMAQFDIDPYHWPGWMLAALTASVGILTLIFFVETRPKRIRFSCVSCSFWGSSTEPKSSWKNIATYMFLVGCAYTVGQTYTVLSALVTPVLNDQFGFNVEYISHFLLAISSAFIISSFIQLGAKFAKMDNRKLLGLFLVCTLVGSALFGDWQSIGHDPCTVSMNTTLTGDPASQEDLSSGSGDGSRDNVCPDDLVTNTTSLLQTLVGSCEAASDSEHACFWNRQSCVTGEYCSECLGVCLSRQRSHNIYQFSIGSLLLAIASPIGYTFLSAIASDITSVKSQGKVASLMLGVGSFSRTVTPFWYIRSYEMTGRHTYVAMAVNTGLALLLLLLLASLYKNLAPVSRDVGGDGVAISATSKLSLEVTEHQAHLQDSDDVFEEVL